MIFYKKHQLNSTYDLTRCRSILKEYEDFNSPSRYFIEWIDQSTFWLSIIGEVGGRLSTPRKLTVAKYLVQISGTEKKPTFTIQRKMVTYDWSRLGACIFLLLLFSYFFYFQSGYLNIGSMLFSIFIFLIFFYPLIKDTGYKFLSSEVLEKKTKDET